MHRSLLILLFSALLVTGGCGGGEPSEEELAKRIHNPGVSEQEALDIAKSAVRERDSFADSADYSITPTGDSGWTITVNGGGGEFRLIVLGEDGEIVKYEGG